MAEQDTCDIEGNSDFYGLGVRAGFYAQWTSTLLANVLVREEDTLSRTINLMLQLAVLICVAFLTLRKAIYIPEVMIAFWLLVGGPWNLTWGPVNRSGTLAALSRAAFYTSLCGYGCWFFFGGWDRLPPTPCESVGFVGGAGMRGGFLPAGKALSIGGLIACASVLGWSAYEHFTSRSRGGGSKTRVKASCRPHMDVALLALSLLAVVLPIVLIEALVRDNHLTGVGDVLEPGQLIPLFVGAFGILGTFVSFVSQERLFAPQCLTLFGRHLT